MSFKHIAKFAAQMVGSIYASKMANKYVGQAFDKVFGHSKKKGEWK
jgi:hypothetical protein